MITFVRKVVGGPKNRIVESDYDLDMTYITDRVIAMAFPASGLEKTYRNSIEDVSSYLNKKHGANYMVFNVSMRKYDYGKFGGRVKDYFWPDHQAPPISTLFSLAKDMYSFLANNQDNVVAVHCNHGKGRTGTAIIAFMLFTGYFKTASETLTFYNKRRFTSTEYGVDQPCQTRVLQFFQAILNTKHFKDRLTAFKLVSVEQKGLDENNYHMTVTSTRSGKIKHLKHPLKSNAKVQPMPLIGDIFIQIFQKGWTGDNQAIRVNYFTEFFIRSADEKTYTLLLKGNEIKVKGDHHKNFQICLKFEYFCNCHKISLMKPLTDSCPCIAQRQVQQLHWQKVKIIVEESKTITKKEACGLLFSQRELEEMRSTQSD